METKAYVYVAISLDGFIAWQNGMLDWLPTPENIESGEDFGYRQFIDSMDVLIMGKNTFEKVASMGEWPYEGIDVVILSHKELEIPSFFKGKIRVLSTPPGKLFDDLSQEGAKRIYVDGGNAIQRFISAGLISEMTLTRIPILLGTGISLFGTLEKDIQCTHLETKQFDNGFVQSRYQLNYEI